MTMKSIKHTFLLLFTFFWAQGAMSQQLTFEQEEMFRDQVKQLMNKYSEGNRISVDFATVDFKLLEQLRTSFIATSKKIVYNDLLPEKVEGSKYLNPVEYAQFAQRYFPEGIDINVEILEITINPKEYKKGGHYEATVKAKKIVRGFYNNLRIHTFSNELYYFISGILVDGKVDGLGITRVIEAKRFAVVQANRRFSGIYVGVSGGYNYSTLFSSAFFSGDNSQSVGSWNMLPGVAIMPTLELHFMFTKGFGLATGLRIGNYAPGMVLEGMNGRVNQLFIDETDSDRDTYYPIYQTDRLVELREIQTYDIPIVMKFRTGNKAVGLYFDMGVLYTMYNSINYTYEGTVTRMGEYPAYNVTLRNIDAYDYWDNRVFNPSDAYAVQDLPKFGLSGLFAMGFSIAPYKNIMIKLGVSANFGFMNVVASDDLASPSNLPKLNYYYTTGNSLGETFLHSASVDFGIYYRVFK